MVLADTAVLGWRESVVAGARDRIQHALAARPDAPARIRRRELGASRTGLRRRTVAVDRVDQPRTAAHGRAHAPRPPRAPVAEARQETRANCTASGYHGRSSGLRGARRRGASADRT